MNPMMKMKLKMLEELMGENSSMEAEKLKPKAAVMIASEKEEEPKAPLVSGDDNGDEMDDEDLAMLMEKYKNLMGG